MKRVTQKEAAGTTLIANLARHLNVNAITAARAAVNPRGRKDARRRFTKNQRAFIYGRDGGVCFYCGAVVAPGDAHADHVIPHARGGRTHEDNGVCACAPCNLSKGAKV